jgi:hypothetical protein
MTANVPELPSASTCLAQISVDLGSLSEEFLQDMVKGMELDETLPPVEAVKKHLGEHPARLPQFMALVIREIHYGQALELFEVVDGDEFFKQHLAEILDCLGASRAYCCFAGLQYLKGGEAAAKVFYTPHQGEGTGIDPLPAEEKVDTLVKTLSEKLIPIKSTLIRDGITATQAAQLRAARAEKELKDARLKWAKAQERMASEAQRAKVKAAEQAIGSVDKSARAEVEAVQQKLDAEIKAHEGVKAKLTIAQARLKEVEDQGGATPERVEEIRKEIQRAADQRIEDELSIAVRPWLVKMLEMEKAQEAMKTTKGLTSLALARAKQEAATLDIIVNWEQDRERGLKALEIEMTELDNLMIRIIKPTPELARMHSELLEAMLTCRKQLNPSKPQGEVAKALIAGLKKVKDEELGDAAYAVRKLAEKGVFLGLEAETLLKIVDGEKQARYDLVHFKKSVQGRMIQRLHAGENVDILIDGYNYMFTAIQHFGDKLKLNRNADGDAVFGEAGRAKLNTLLLPLAAKFPNLELHVFYDGLVKENCRPHARISLWEPTYQRSGKGQADAEIAHVGLKRIRKGSMAVVVTNDKVVQLFADHFLSARVFSDFIATA